MLRDSLEGSLPSFLSFQLLFKQHFSGLVFFQLSGAISIVKHSLGHYDIDLTCYASLTSLPLSPFCLIFSLYQKKSFPKGSQIQPLDVFPSPVSQLYAPERLSPITFVDITFTFVSPALTSLRMAHLSTCLSIS